MAIAGACTPSESDPPPPDATTDGGPDNDGARPDGAGSDASLDAEDASADASDASDSGCIDTTSNPLHCGACGYACKNGRACVAGRCTPAWQPTSMTSVPAGRDRHAATSLGTKYVATGGTLTFQGVAIGNAVSYDLATSTWSTFPSHVSARLSHQLVTTGSKLYAYGGITDAANGATIGPGLEESSGGAWTAVTAANAPKGRYNFGMVWTGTEIMLYGGGDDAVPANASGARLVPGGAWTDASCALVGCERGGYYTLFRDGAFVRVVGGGPFGDAPAGLAYDLVAKTWAPWNVPAGGPAVSTLPKDPADDGRRIFWVREPAACTDPPSVLVYDRKTQTWSTDTSTPPTGLLARGAATWVDGELVTWSGDCGAGPTTVGGRFQPAAPPP